MTRQDFIDLIDSICVDLETEEYELNGSTENRLKPVGDAIRLFEIRLTDGPSLYTTPYYLYKVYDFYNCFENDIDIIKRCVWAFKTCDRSGKNPVHTHLSVNYIMCIHELPIFIDKSNLEDPWN